MYFKRHVSEEFGVSARVNEKFQGLYKSCVGWAFPLSCWAVGHQLGCKCSTKGSTTFYLLQLSPLFLLGQNCLSLVFKSIKIILRCSIRWLSFRPSFEVTLRWSCIITQFLLSVHWIFWENRCFHFNDFWLFNLVELLTFKPDDQCRLSQLMCSQRPRGGGSHGVCWVTHKYGGFWTVKARRLIVSRGWSLGPRFT